MRARAVFVLQARRRADARHLVPGRVHRGRVSRCVARGGRARGHQADRGGAEQRGRRQAHHLAQLRGPQPEQCRVQSQRGHGPRDAGRARPPGRGAGRLSARRQGAADLAFQQRQRPAGGQPGLAVQDPQRARAVDPRRAERRQAAAAHRGRGPRRHQRPDRARSACRSRPGAPARLCHHAGRDLARAARGQFRPAGGPGVRRGAGLDPARRGPGARSQAICRSGGLDQGRTGLDPGRPGPGHRARARARLDGTHQRPAGHQLRRLQAAGRQHRGHRRGRQGGDGGGAQDAAAGCRAGPDLCLERLRQGLADRPACTP